MPKRIQRVNQLIKKEISQLLLKEVGFPKNILVTVTRAETSANLIQAKIYISVMPENQSKRVLGILNYQIYNLQQRLNKRLKMRPIPKIEFVEEKKTKEAGKIEKLLEEIKNEQYES